MTLLSGMWKLNLKDVAKGAVTAVVAAALMSVFAIVSQPNFDLFTVDWASIANAAVNAAFAAFVGYLGKNLLTDERGKVFGRL
jgi:hypothetical protein